MSFFDSLVGQNNPTRINIVDNPSINAIHRLPKMQAQFETDLLIYYNVINGKLGRVTKSDMRELVIYYCLDLMIEYQRKALNQLPVSIINDVKEQVLKGFAATFDFVDINLMNELASEIDKRLCEPTIITKTNNFMNSLQSEDTYGYKAF